MMKTPTGGPERPGALNVRRLIWLRSIAIPGPAVCLLIASRIYNLGIPVLPLVAIVLLLVTVNVWTWRRLRQPVSIGNNELFAQMLVDVAALTGIIYFSGGGSNPFAFFFLLPLTISATLLPRAQTWVMAGITGCCYTALLFFRVPVDAFRAGGEESIPELHIVGMWLGFVLIAGLISHYVVGMGETLRDQDRRLSEAREKALNDEKMVALATLAAGAAHELSTPLNTMAVVLSELSDDPSRRSSAAIDRDLGILRDQIQRCKAALSVMSSQAGAGRAGDTRATAIERLLTEVIAQVRNLRPGARIDLNLGSTGPEASVIADKTISQALINILHNAVDVSPADVEVQGERDGSYIRIDILDRGPGIRKNLPHQPAGAGKKADGLGVGLMISRAALERIGGSLDHQPREGGGSRAVVRLPVS